MTLNPLSLRQIVQIKKLRREGYSYKEIARRSRTSVGSVYKYARRVILTASGKLRLLRSVLNRRRNFADRFARLKQVKPRIHGLNIAKARLLGHVLFDGIATSHVISYATASTVLARQFWNDLRMNYLGLGPKIRIYRAKNLDIYHVYGASQLACKDLRSFLMHADQRDRQTLKPAILASERALLSEIARAFWEDEGSVSDDGNVIGELSNRPLRNQLLSIHRELGIDVRPYRDRVNRMFGVYLKRDPSNLQLFDRVVGFRKSTVTRGRNAGKLKRSVFVDHLRRRLG